MRRAFVMGSNGSTEVGFLKFARKNACDVKAALEDPACGFQVSTPSEGADATAVLTQLSAASEACSPDDTFVCYFSGHGYVEPGEGQLYLCWDQTQVRHKFTSSMPALFVMGVLNGCKARNRLLLLDCCHAGAALGGGQALKSAAVPVEPLMPSSNFVVLAASDRLEKTRELDSIEGSLFSVEICAALGKDRLHADFDRDDRISVADLKLWLDQRTHHHNAQCPDQPVPYPHLFGHQRGNPIYLSEINLPHAQRYTLTDVVERWLRWEAQQYELVGRQKLENRPEVVDSPLKELFWDDFINVPAWHHLIASRLEQAASHAARFAETTPLVARLRAVDCSLNYEQLRDRLRPLLGEGTFVAVRRLISRLERDARRVRASPKQNAPAKSPEEYALQAAVSLRNALADLQGQVKNPQYGRCFLVTGSQGSGKTHFMRTLLNEEKTVTLSVDDIDDLCLVMPLAPTYPLAPIEQLIGQTLRDATGIAWKDVEEFDRFLQRPDTSGEGRGAVPLVIVLDDLQRWFSLAPELVHTLTDFIARHTQLHSLYWVLTLQDSSYDQVATTTRFWQEYGFRWEGRLMGTSGFAPLATRTRASARSRQPGIPHIGGWIDLNQLNEEAALGRQIIRAVLEEDQGSTSFAFEEAREEIPAQTTRLLSNPFLAWILLDQRDQLSLPHLVDLRFIAFVEDYWNRCLALLESHIRTEVYTDRLSLAELTQALELIAKSLLASPHFSPTRTQLLTDVTALAQGTSELQERSKAETAVRLLTEINLLHINVSHTPLAPAGTTEHVELPFEIFWEWQIAQGLHAALWPYTASPQDFRRRLALRLAQAGEKQIRDGVFIFFLLYLDQPAWREAASSRLIDSLWLMGVRSQELPFAATWLAAPKATVPAQELLVEWVVRHADTSEWHQRLGERHNLFAFMYFISEALDEALAIPQRFRLLQPHFQTVQSTGLSSYYLHIARRLLRTVIDNEVMLTCMPFFSGCEVMECAPAVADLTLEVLISNVGNNLTALQGVLTSYLQTMAGRSRSDRDTHKASRKWQRMYYREWVLAGFCRLLVNQKGLEAFHLLRGWQWYQPQRLGIGSPVALEMQREANIALGRWYQMKASPKEQKDFVKLVETLVESRDARDGINAFHLVRHTVPTAGERGVPVDPVFRDVLRTIVRDKQMSKTVESYSEFFLINLPELARRKNTQGRK
jgi:hypothetical protein